jgi:hypothetical protein
MRYILTDGLNSIWHVIFGMMGYCHNIISILFVSYQIITETPEIDNNMPIDLMEFILGCSITYLLKISGFISFPDLTEPCEIESLDITSE